VLPPPPAKAPPVPSVSGEALGDDVPPARRAARRLDSTGPPSAFAALVTPSLAPLHPISWHSPFAAFDFDFESARPN
jgi:hypothetical protein